LRQGASGESTYPASFRFGERHDTDVIKAIVEFS
jgi:hypothetical protein